VVLLIELGIQIHGSFLVFCIFTVPVWGKQDIQVHETLRWAFLLIEIGIQIHGSLLVFCITVSLKVWEA